MFAQMPGWGINGRHIAGKLQPNHVVIRSDRKRLHRNYLHRKKQAELRLGRNLLSEKLDSCSNSLNRNVFTPTYNVLTNELKFKDVGLVLHVTVPVS